MMIHSDDNIFDCLNGLPFVKAQALGNDFVIIQLAHIKQPLTDEALAQCAIFLADRHYGIGCDQVISVEQTTVNNDAFLQIRFFNSDGSEAESCGNGSRAFALWWMGLHQLTTITFGTKSGLITATKGEKPHSIELYLPIPTIDLTIPLDDFSDRLSAAPVFVNVGNPHLVLYVDHVVDVDRMGAYVEKHSLFRSGVNVNFIHMDRSNYQKNQLSISVWERGVGRTKACGTGGVASAVASVARGFIDKKHPIIINQEGGVLVVLYGEEQIRLVGKAHIVFEGTLRFCAQ